MNKYSKKRSLCWLAAMTAASTLVGGFVYAQRPKEITLVLDGKKIHTYSEEPTVEDLLGVYGITVQEAKIDLPKDTKISDDLVITVNTKKTIALTDGGKKTTVTTYQNTVKELLHEQGISVDEDDEIRPGMQALLSEDKEVEVDHIQIEDVKTQEKIPFTTEEQEDASMYQGDETVVRDGADGVKEVVSRITRRNGNIEKKAVLSETQKKAPVSKLIKKGTKELPVAGDGTELRNVQQTLVMEATAYTHSGARTASGAWPQAHYTVATDPSVIPLGTKMYIEGYGYAEAQDTGGAIQGNIIDLFFDTEGECQIWGRQDVVVHILGE